MPRESTAKHWCFTAWDTDPRTLFDAQLHHYLIVGEEVCPETGREHYQSYVQYIKKVRFTSVKACFGNTIHVEKSKGTDQDNYDYCIKEGNYSEMGTRVNTTGTRTDLQTAAAAAMTMPWEDLLLDPVHSPTVARHMQYFRSLYTTTAAKRGLEALMATYSSVVLRDWQSDLLAKVTGPVDPRKFYWYHDYTGDTGKSWFARYLMAIHKAAIFTNGKMADIAFAYALEPIVIFDLSRTQADKIDHIYSLIENFKNGIMFSPKYESGTKIFAPPHVIVFANFIPDILDRANKLSGDRWLTHELSS